METDKAKFEKILSVYKGFYTILAASSPDVTKAGAQTSAAILTSIYFDQGINYLSLKDSIRDGIEESRPINVGPL